MRSATNRKNEPLRSQSILAACSIAPFVTELGIFDLASIVIGFSVTAVCKDLPKVRGEPWIGHLHGVSEQTTARGVHNEENVRRRDENLRFLE